jgi:hypothetical protein
LAAAVDIHPDIDIVVYPGFFFTGSRPQHPAEILQEASAESDGSCQKQGRQVFVVESLADQLAGGDEDPNFAVVEPFQDRLALAVLQFAGEQLAGNLVPIF